MENEVLNNALMFMKYMCAYFVNLEHFSNRFFLSFSLQMFLLKDRSGSVIICVFSQSQSNTNSALSLWLIKNTVKRILGRKDFISVGE